MNDAAAAPVGAVVVVVVDIMAVVLAAELESIFIVRLGASLVTPVAVTAISVDGVTAATASSPACFRGCHSRLYVSMYGGCCDGLCGRCRNDFSVVVLVAAAVALGVRVVEDLQL